MTSKSLTKQQFPIQSHKQEDILELQLFNHMQHIRTGNEYIATYLSVYYQIVELLGIFFFSVSRLKRLPYLT